jgi:hypothetical protein
MSIYCSSNNIYKYKDFSTGKSGDGLNLVLELFNLTSRGESAHKIISDYNEYIIVNNIAEIKPLFKKAKYKIHDFTIRQWTNLDEKFWTKFKIDSVDLEYYNIKPLANYKLIKEDDDGFKEQIIKNYNIYGYFRKDGSLYKIYQPYLKDYKFIKIMDYIQGSDQLTMNVPYLIICSSLKDVIAFSKLGYNNSEAVAPDSENTIIPEHVINAYKYKYKNIVTLFDNDTAGIESMKKYNKKYDIPYIVLNMSKDLSDSIKDFGLIKTRTMLTPLLKEKLTVTVNV